MLALSAKTRAIDSLLIATTGLFLVTDAIGAPLRYALSAMGAEPVIYLPRILVLIAVLAGTAVQLTQVRQSRILLIAIGLLLWSGLIGLVFVRSIPQVLWGAYSIAPTLLGILAYPVFRANQNQFGRYFAFLWTLAVLGVAIDSMLHVPWSSVTYRIGDYEIQSSRQLTYYGYVRHSGFARDAFQAAYQLLILGFAVTTVWSRHRLNLLLWMISGICLVFTVVKTAIMVFLIATGCRLVRALAPRLPWGIMPAVACAAAFALPVAAVFASLQVNAQSEVGHFAFATLDARAAILWPKTFELVAHNGSVLFGRGLGGIGSAQKLFEPALYLPGDNMFLYLYVVTGLGACAMGLWLFGAVLHYRPCDSGIDLFMYLIVFATFLIGATMNVFESGYISLFFGLALRHVATRVVRYSTCERSAQSRYSLSSPPRQLRIRADSGALVARVPTASRTASIRRMTDRV